MIVSGRTTHKLDIVKTYSKTEPYKVGVNGVTKINLDQFGNESEVEYNINGIDYVTRLNDLITTFKYNPDDFERGLNEVGKTYIREEGKIGLSFEIKTNNQIFIERDLGAILERHSRISEITNLDDLEDYRNGYYYVKKEI
jgi:hypothetical protein